MYLNTTLRKYNTLERLVNMVFTVKIMEGGESSQ
jgi:hypothetical protein